MKRLDANNGRMIFHLHLNQINPQAASRTCSSAACWFWNPPEQQSLSRIIQLRIIFILILFGPEPSKMQISSFSRSPEPVPPRSNLLLPPLAPLLRSVRNSDRGLTDVHPKQSQSLTVEGWSMRRVMVGMGGTDVVTATLGGGGVRVKLLL